MRTHVPHTSKRGSLNSSHYILQSAKRALPTKLVNASETTTSPSRTKEIGGNYCERSW